MKMRKRKMRRMRKRKMMNRRKSTTAICTRTS